MDVKRRVPLLTARNRQLGSCGNDQVPFRLRHRRKLAPRRQYKPRRENRSRSRKSHNTPSILHNDPHFQIVTSAKLYTIPFNLKSAVQRRRHLSATVHLRREREQFDRATQCRPRDDTQHESIFRSHLSLPSLSGKSPSCHAAECKARRGRSGIRDGRPT